MWRMWMMGRKRGGEVKQWRRKGFLELTVGHLYLLLSFSTPVVVDVVDVDVDVGVAAVGWISLDVNEQPRFSTMKTRMIQQLAIRNMYPKVARPVKVLWPRNSNSYAANNHDAYHTSKQVQSNQCQRLE
jgi:hypothetical protein